MRIVFAGTPEVAVPGLRALAEAGQDVRLALTRPDAPVGRRRVLTPSPVATAAEALGVPVRRAARVDAAVTEDLAATAPDLGVVIAYGGLIPRAALDVPRLGWINVHFSLLPHLRGAAPVQRAIMAGEREGGVTVFALTEELDTGDVYARAPYRFGRDETAGEALGALAGLGRDVLLDVVRGLEAGTARATPQEGEPTWAPKLSAADGKVDWTESARAVAARIRGVTPEPGAHTDLESGRLKILRARDVEAAGAVPGGPGTIFGRDGRVYAVAGDGLLELREVQPAGRRPMPAGDWWRGGPGTPVRAGTP